MDLLARTSTPHERSFHISILLVVVVIVVWIVIGKLDHSLWIQDFKRVSNPVPSISSNENPTHGMLLEFEIELHESDASILQPGLPVYLLSRQEYVSTVHQGTLVQTFETNKPFYFRAVCRFDTQAQDVLALPDLASNHTIRIPLSELTPLQHLARLSRTAGFTIN